MAVALSCKYWYNQFREMIVHPMLAYSAGDEWFMLRRGQIYGSFGGSIDGKIRQHGEDESLITRNNDENSLKISLIRDFLRYKVVSSAENCQLDELPGNVIKIDICHSIISSIVLSVYVDIWGNVQYSYVRCRQATRTTFHLKRSKTFFRSARHSGVHEAL